MRKAFTLIELMIVIAIIAIIAAIAIPNLLESRVTANESAAAASLKSGFFAGQVQFQSGAYSDVDGDGRGEYAREMRALAGSTAAPTSTNFGVTPKALTLLAPTFNVVDDSVVGAYKYRIEIAGTDGTDAGIDPDGVPVNVNLAESFWGAWAAPAAPGNDGRRAFGINVAGVVYATKQTVVDADLTLAKVGNAGANPIFASDPTQSNASANATNASPYQK